MPLTPQDFVSKWKRVTTCEKQTYAEYFPDHKKLDQAVFAAYGCKSDLSDEEILEKLLALNLERSQPK